jgi:hypothetical protein
MSQQKGKWIEDNAIKQNHIQLDNDQAMRGRNQADSADIDIIKVNATDQPEFLTQPQYANPPVLNADLANKGYILDVLAGLRDPKDAVKVASTANVDIATGGLINVDGLVVAAGDRVLLKNQTDDTENGIYVAAAGAWARSTDADSDPEVTQGMSCLVSEGLTNVRKIYVLTTSDPIVVGTSSLVFAQAPNPANFLVPEEASIAINATIVGNGFFDLPHLAEAKSVKLFPLGGPKQEYLVDYTIAPNAGVSRITFAGDLATRIADGDTLLVEYSYATA